MQITFGQIVILVVAFAAAILMVLLSAGLIGPKRFRKRVRRLVTWYWQDASPFMALDPYKPAGEALKEGVDNFLPTKQRFRNNLTVALGQFLIFFGILALGLVLYIVWRSR